ncbi:hypothetical protein VHEMI08774 [[Torrubiella] hemipterigena]|uniref:Nudix hydrolase domain-containing protein n=1 Tax=[Torrubiella] hemipterigena TaxID=1531966 RepID=A0A0A1TNW0_9HYPO|nr:hypothetical protein VHEMI08774 [[Torrubiella] hemipterigena]
MTSPPSFTYDACLEEFNVPYKQWLATKDKTWNGIASGAIIFQEDRVLLVQRAPDDSMPNLWEIPGGAVDPEDASILAGCVREVFEETGLRVKHIRRLVTEGADGPEWTVFTNRTGKRFFVKFTFEVDVEEGADVVLDPVEHQSWVFATKDEVEKQAVGELRIPLATPYVRRLVVEGFRLRDEAGSA